ncbi:hypothetical protein Mgra_00002135 [Meloidogyne graminicola]|uniref:Uncharacterized protein n=1 Tax=Meloidogyne graminicola TaxID=189291 RepID=A0A8S9ZYX0_9BILA|nr:hypothetical protein Mgra_00002135 [Meloidogyne graminicola]
MSKAKKVRNTKEKSDDSDYQLGIDEFTDEDDELIQINTSNGRISKTGKNDENSKDDVDISVQVPMKPCAPNISKVYRYLEAIKQTQNNSIHFLNEEEIKVVFNYYLYEKSGKQTLSQFWLTNLNRICSNSQIDKPLDFSCWRRIDDFSSSLTRWLGTKSIGLIIQSSVPTGIQSIIDCELDKPLFNERKPLPVKMPRKRGRPRKNQLWELNRLLASPEDEPVDNDSLTVNEHLQSLVSEQIKATSSIINHKSKSKGLFLIQSTSFNDELHQATPSLKHKNISNTSLNRKGRNSKSPKSFIQNTIKLEVEDFSLPTGFSNGINYPIPSLLSTDNNKVKNARTKTSNRSHTKNSITDEVLNTPSTSNQQIPQQIQNGENLNSKSLNSSIRKESSKTNSKQTGHGIVNLPLAKDKQINIPIFSGKTFPFDVDVSPTVERFESVQVVDIFNSLSSKHSSLQKTTKFDSLMPSQNSLDLLSQNRIDRHNLQKIKSNRQFAQTIFCGGPIADISVCPRLLPDGRELFVVATFADEKYLYCNKTTDDIHSYLQFWTTNIKSTDSNISDPKLVFLLRIPNSKHICSINWCPTQIKTENNESPPLGLLAVSTFTGRIHIYSIPSNFDAFMNLNLCSSASLNGNESIPPVFESIPLLTLCHAPLRKIKVETRDELNDRKNNTASSIKEGLDSIPLFKVQWSPFDGSRHIAAISASCLLKYIFFIFGDSNEVTLPLWTLPIDGLASPPMSIGWLEKDQICVSYRNRQFLAYKLLYPNLDNTQPFHSARLILECESAKGSGIFCNTQPLLFSGALTFDSYAFNYLGTQQQALCYLSLQQKMNDGGNIVDVIASNLSNCHQIRLTSACICPNSGICLSVGADGRLCSSLNGRLAPKIVTDVDTFMHGRSLLQLISHRNNSISFDDDDNNTTENEGINFCFSHVDCLAEKFLEIRLGDCALLEQKNYGLERVNGRPLPETCIDRRLEALTVVDCSPTSVGLTFCGGDSGLKSFY